MRVLLLICLSNFLFAAMPKIKVWQANGIPVWFLPKNDVPMLNLAMVFDAGALQETKSNIGVAKLVPEGIFAGCGNVSAKVVAQSLESHGAIYSADAGADWATVSLQTLTDAQHLMPVVQQFSDCLHKPKFEASVLKQARRSLLSERHAKQLSAGSLAIQEFNRQYYGPMHAYGRFLIPEAKILQRITGGQLQAFHKQYYLGSAVHLVMVGAITEVQARSIANEITRGMNRANLPKKYKSLAAHKVLSKQLKLPNQAQVTTIIGMPGYVYGPQDQMLLKFIIWPFSGQFKSRLMQELRTKLGYVYAASSMYMQTRHGGQIFVKFGSRAEVAQPALEKAKIVIADYFKSGLTDTELAQAKLYYQNSFYRAISENSGLLNLMLSGVYKGLQPDYFYNYLANMNKLTLSEVNQRIAKIGKLIKPVAISVENAKS